jgi:flagellar hook-length control protein FliK
MNLNLSLDLNVSEVISPKGNADRQPLWNDEPIEREFDQLLQEKLDLPETAVEDGATLPAANELVTRQELAAQTDKEANAAESETSALTTEVDEQASLLNLIQNARSYDVSVDKPADGKQKTAEQNLTMDKELDGSDGQTVDNAISLLNAPNTNNLLTVEGDKSSELTSQLSNESLPETHLSKSASVTTTTAHSLSMQAIDANTQIANADEELALRSAENTKVSNALSHLQKVPGMASAEVAKSMQAEAPSAEQQSSLSDNSTELDAAAKLANSAKTEMPAAQNELLDDAQGAQNKAAMPSPLGKNDSAAQPQSTLASNELAKVAKKDVEPWLSIEDAKPWVSIEDAKPWESLEESKTPSLPTGTRVSAPTSEQSGIVLKTATSSEIKTMTMTPPTQPEPQTNSTAMAKVQVEAASVIPVNASQIAAQSISVEAGSQTISLTPSLNISGAGADTQQSFAEHQKQQNQSHAGQTANLQAQDMLQKSAETEGVAGRVAAPTLDATLSGSVSSVRTDLPPTLQTVAAAPLSASSHNLQASSPIAAQQTALQTEKMATLSANLSLQEPSAAIQLKDRVMYQLNQKIQTAEVKITPEDLGTVQIKVNLQQEQLSVQFVVQQANAKELLEQQMPKLKELLQQQGLQLSESQVEQRQANERRQSHDEKSGQRGYQGRFEGDAELAPAAVLAKQSDRMVDYYA